jgi:hypothetical protein
LNPPTSPSPNTRASPQRSFSVPSSPTPAPAHWASGAYSNAPHPSALPLPAFSEFKPSASLPQPSNDELSKASNELRRLLGLSQPPEVFA